MNDLCSFEEFFTACTGHAPYLWQAELAARFARGETPGVIDVPTGLGKTSTILCWAWAFAVDQHRLRHDLSWRRRVQTRFHLVVDRRLLVDSAADVADDLAARLREALELDDEGPLGQVARVLEPLRSLDGELLSVRRLRGGTGVGAEHVRDPKVPAVITSTVDMFGSRVLWRGYGLSASRRSIDAALAGADSLVVLDEAHLVPQFVHVLGDLAHQQVWESGFGSLPPRRVVVMTATWHGDGDDAVRVDMAAERSASPGLDARRSRREAVEVARRGGVELVDAAKEVMAGLEPGRGAVVFCNQVATATSLDKAFRVEARRLAKQDGRDVEVVCVVGGVPQPVREEVLRKKLNPFLTGNPAREQAPATIVVSTQALEVGADLDFDHGISELAPLPSLVQRLGRVNRIGARSGGRFEVVGQPKKGTDGKVGADPIYGGVPAAVGVLLDRELGGSGTVASFMDLVADHADDEALMVEAAPLTSLTPAEFGELLDTANEATAMDISVLLRPRSAQWQCQVVFRDRIAGLLGDRQGLEQYLQAFRPRRWEQWSVSASSGQAPMKVLAGASLAMIDRHGVVHVMEYFDPGDKNGPSRIGATLVVDPGTMGDKAGFVQDYGVDMSGRRPAGEPAFALVSSAGLDLEDPEQVDELAMGADFDPTRARIVELVDGLCLVSEVSTGGINPLTDGVRVPLDRHNQQVGTTVRQWSESLGLPERVVATIAEAGLRHDLGKDDPGFQYLLHLSRRGRARLPEYVADGEVLAKSDLPWALGRSARWLARRDGGLLPGFRHEAASVDRSRELGYDGLGVDVELLEYLVATHHGHWHGLGPAIGGGAPALQDSSDPAWAAWPETVRRLQRRYGPYTLALAEALVRLADWECSANVMEEGL